MGSTLPTVTSLTMKVELTENQVSLILYCLEGYVQGNDDHDLVEEVDEIFEVLENIEFSTGDVEN